MARIVGIGGTTKPMSSTESALKGVLDHARLLGADTQMFGAEALVQLPHYGTDEAKVAPMAMELVQALRTADGVVLASPGYHGSVSGLVKNAIDYIEELARDERCYLDGMPVGLVVTAFGWQATGSTMATMRSIVHALRGWPTPMGAAIKTYPGLFGADGCTDDAVFGQLKLVASQVTDMCGWRHQQQVKAFA